VTDEQAALVRKSRQSLRAAQLLCDDHLYDFAVSRAYYAMFYVVQALLLSEGLTFSKHAAVIAAFGQRYAKSGRVPVAFHRYLIEAHESRNIGDYDTGSGFSEEQAGEHIDRAHRLLEHALTMLDTPAGPRS